MTQEPHTESPAPDISDAEITTITVLNDGCEVRIEGDVQGILSLFVPDTIGLIETSCIRESLSHMSWSAAEEAHRRFFARAETTKENVHVLQFFSAWTSDAILEIFSTSRVTTIRRGPGDREGD